MWKRRSLKLKSAARKRYGIRRAVSYIGKLAYRGKSLRYKHSKKGFLKILRKYPEIWMSNSTGAGTAVLSTTSGLYSGNSIQLGTPTLNANGTYDVPFSLAFYLNELLQVNDITTLCDKYKIIKAYVRVIPSFTQNALGGLYSMPTISYITDGDDNTPPTTALIREKMGVKVKQFVNGRMVKMLVRPTTLGQVYQSAVATAYQVGGARWLDCNYSAVPHYGIKGVINNVDLPAASTSKVFFKFDIALLVAGKDFQ